MHRKAIFHRFFFSLRPVHTASRLCMVCICRSHAISPTSWCLHSIIPDATSVRILNTNARNFLLRILFHQRKFNRIFSPSLPNRCLYSRTMFLYSDTDFYLYSSLSLSLRDEMRYQRAWSLLLSIGKSILEEKVESIFHFVSVAATIWRFFRKTLNDSNIRLNASEKGFYYRIKVIDSIVFRVDKNTILW